nr:MAG: hypothetical protein DIU60_25685 [Actinomycetota bacterium]
MSQSGTGNVGSPDPVAEDERRPSEAAEQVEERPPSPEIDISKPHIARMYDYYLGGKHNYAIDRQTAEQFLKAWPEAPIGARLNRRFLIESVRWLAQEAGIRQFFDIGSGLPTQQNVHEVAQSVAKDSRVVYVDNDPLVRVHADVLLATDPNTIFLTGDLREPEELLGRPELRDHLDLSKPVALLLVAVLQFIEDNQQAYDIVKTLCDALPAGSYLVLSHPLKDESVEQALAVYRRANIGGRSRTEEEIRRFFDGLTPVGCGLARAAEWTPPDGITQSDNVIPLGDPEAFKKMPGMFGIARIDR